MSVPLSLQLLQLAADFTELALVWLVQSTVILLGGLAAGWLVVRRGPALQSAVYRATLVAVAVGPVLALLLCGWGPRLGWTLPAIDVVVVRTVEPVNATDPDIGVRSKMPKEQLTRDRAGAVGALTEAEPARHRVEHDASAASYFSAGPPVGDPAYEMTESADVEPQHAFTANSAASAANDAHRESAREIQTRMALFVVAVSIIWLCTSLVLLGGLLIGLARMARLCRDATPAEVDEQRLCDELVAAIGVHPPRLLRTPFLDSPCLAGVLRPAILLPEGSLDVPIRAVLLHELAHLRRHDHVWNLASRIMLATFFFQPLLGRLVRRLNIAAEEVCDDHVIHFGTDRTRYANGLVALAEQSSLPLPTVGVPLFTLRSQLARRVRRILDHSGAPSLRITRAAVCGVLAAGVLATTLGGFFGAGGNRDSTIANAATSDDAHVANNDDKSEKEGTLTAGKDTKDSTATGTTEKATSTDDEPLPAGAIARLGTTRFRPGDGTQAVSFLPDKRTLVVTKSDGRLQYWDAQSGRFLRDARFGKPQVSAAAHTRDGRFVAARGWYHEGNPQRSVDWVALIDAQTGQKRIRHELDDRSGGRHVVVAENASAIAVDGRNVTLIDLTKGEVIEWPLDKLRPTSLDLSPDGNMLAVGSPGLVRVWKWRESREPRYFAIARKDPRTQAHINSIRFSPDGSLLAVGDHMEGVSLIDLSTGKEIHHLTMEGIDGWRGEHLAFSPDGRLLATPISPFSGGGVAIWQVESGKLVKRLEMPYDGVRNTTFSSDGRFLAGIPWDAMLCVWNVATGELAGRDLAGHQEPPNTIRFLPGDERLASAGDDSSVHLWNVNDAEPECVIRHERDEGYARMIRGMDVSPNGAYVASSCLDNTVRIWERTSGRELHRLPGHGNLGGHRSVRFTPDSQRLVSWGDDMRLAIYDVMSGKAVVDRRLKPSGVEVPEDRRYGARRTGTPGDEYGLQEGVLSPDASRLVVALKAMHVFDVETGRELIEFDRPERTFVSSLTISHDNQYLLMLGWGYGDEIPTADGKTTRRAIQRTELRRMSHGELVAEMDRGDGAWPAAAAFSPDSRRAAITVGKEEPRVVIVKIPELTEIIQIDGFRASPRALEFSHSGKMLAVSNGDTTVLVYELDKLRAQAQPNRPDHKQQQQDAESAIAPPHTLNATAEDESLPAGAVARLGTTRFRPPNGGEAVSFLPGDHTLALLTRDGALEYWNAQSGRFLREVQVAKRWIPHAEHTPDGRFIAAYGRGMDYEQRRHMHWVALFDAVEGRELTRVELEKWYDGPLAVAANGTVVATAYKDVKIIDVNRGEMHDWPIEGERPQSLALSPDGNMLAVGSPGLVRLWEWRARQEPRYFVIASKDPRNKPGVSGLTFSPDASLLAASDRGISLFDLRSGEETHRLSMEGVDSWQSNHPIFSPDGKLVAAPISKYQGGGVAVWEVASGKLAKRLEMPHEGVTHIAFSSDGQLIAGSNWWESLLCVWNIETGELLGRDLAGHKTPPNTIRFLPGDERLASAGDDSSVHLWNVNDAEPERVIRHERDEGYARMIRGMDVSPDGRYVASSCLDDTVRVWERASGRELHRLPGHGDLGGHRSVRFTPDSQRLVSWGDDMRLAIYDVMSGRTVVDRRLKPSGVEVTGDRKYGARETGAPGDEYGLQEGVLSPDASRLVLALKAMHVFDVATGRELIKFDRPERTFVSSLMISHDNQYLLMLGWGYGDEIPTADGKTTRPAIQRSELRKLSSGELVAEMNREDGGWSGAAFSPDSRRAAITVGHANPRVVIIKIPEMTEVARIDGLRASPRVLEFSHSGKLLAVSNGDTSVVVYELDKIPGNK